MYIFFQKNKNKNKKAVDIMVLDIIEKSIGHQLWLG